MAQIITMPRLSDTMTEGVVAQWLKKVGDKIEEGDILAEIETDKATMEFESFNEGTLLHIGIAEGESAPIDALLAIIGDQGEDISDLLQSKTNGANDKNTEETAVPLSTKTTTSETSNKVTIPENMHIITMPLLSDTMTEGTIASWFKSVGDAIAEGDILAEIETDKATMEFESFNEGTLLYQGLKEGETAPVDTLLAIIGEAGTDVNDIVASYKSDSKNKTAPSSEPTTAAAAPLATPTKQPVTTNSNSNGRVLASPLAKKMAKEKNIDLKQLAGSGEQGRITKKDVENYSPSATSTTTSTTTSTSTTQAAATSPLPAIVLATGEEKTESMKNSQMRKTIARRLGESKFTAPHYYLAADINMDTAIESRKAMNDLPETKVSFNDMVVKASAMALKKHPQVNSSWSEAETILNHHVHIGVAVAVEDGLLVPVVKFTDQLSMTQIGAQVKSLAIKAKTKKISPQEMEGSTFTVSNLGMFGIPEFTSIINQPNSAILSVGAIVQQPIVKNEALAVGNIMRVTLACDHRTVDGATGAQFLQTLKQYMENPVTMLA